MRSPRAPDDAIVGPDLATLLRDPERASARAKGARLPAPDDAPPPEPWPVPTQHEADAWLSQKRAELAAFGIVEDAALPPSGVKAKTRRKIDTRGSIRYDKSSLLGGGVPWAAWENPMRSLPPPDLAALLADPARLAHVPPEHAPALLVAIAAEHGRLATLEGALAARLAVPAPPSHGRPEEDDVITDVAQVGEIAHRSVSWVRRNGHALPGFRQPGGKGCKVAWSRAELVAWARCPGA